MTPNNVDVAIANRIEIAQKVILSQKDFFHAYLGKASVSIKSDKSRVTEADLAISKNILSALADSFPLDNFCSEESEVKQFDLKPGFSWVLDPIDGTDNFSLGIPLCGISLALLQDGFPVYGLIYDASTQKLLQGGKNIGVWCDRQEIQTPPDIFDSLSLTAFHGPVRDYNMPLLAPFLDGKSKLRSLGSAVLSLAYLATSKVHGYMDFQLKIWDFCAGYAILEALSVEFTFLCPSPFPLQSFDVYHTPCRFYTGVPSFCKFIKTLVS